ncbi:hypothetical protein JCM14076_05790 [Methylosoma difficile]
MSTEDPPHPIRTFFIEEIVLALMLVLSLIGVWITDNSPPDSYEYWMVLMLVFALFAIGIAWLQSKHSLKDFTAIVREQTLHWLTSLAVVQGVYALQRAREFSIEDAGLIVLMILAQSTLLDGLRIGWRFGLVGVFLGLSAVIAAYIKHFFWIELFIAAAIVASTLFWEIWIRKKAAE